MELSENIVIPTATAIPSTMTLRMMSSNCCCPTVSFLPFVVRDPVA
jgi:hypothetical protein